MDKMAGYKEGVGVRNVVDEMMVSRFEWFILKKH